jgi:hypothetical protein
VAPGPGRFLDEKIADLHSHAFCGTEQVHRICSHGWMVGKAMEVWLKLCDVAILAEGPVHHPCARRATYVSQSIHRNLTQTVDPCGIDEGRKMCPPVRREEVDLTGCHCTDC